MAYISIRVDLGEIYDDLTRSEKKDLADWLEDDGIIDCQYDSDDTIGGNLINEEFMESCVKLGGSYYQMSKEDEEVILGLVKKYS